MEIRKARSGDLEAVVGLWTEMMRFHAEQDRYFEVCVGAEEKFREFAKNNLSEPEKIFLVAEENGKIDGYILGEILTYPPVYESKPYGNVLDIIVKGTGRRKGVGQQLLEATCKGFAARGIEEVECQVSSANPVSNKFWQKMGFRETMKQYYRKI